MLAAPSRVHGTKHKLGSVYLKYQASYCEILSAFLSVHKGQSRPQSGLTAVERRELSRFLMARHQTAVHDALQYDKQLAKDTAPSVQYMIAKFGVECLRTHFLSDASVIARFVSTKSFISACISILCRNTSSACVLGQHWHITVLPLLPLVGPMRSQCRAASAHGCRSTFQRT
jgi:hypothetical protein